MKRKASAWCLAMALALPVSLAACERSESPAPAPATAPEAAPAPTATPFRVTGVTVGSAIGPDKRVSAPATKLAPGDTIYAAVESEGSASGVQLRARWTYEGDTLVNEESLSIAPSGPASTEFHIAKPDGWPAGSYQVEILADGAPVASAEFQVE